MQNEFHQVTWDGLLEQDFLALLQMAVREDLGETGDWTTQALVPETAMGRAAVAARQPGVVAGLRGAPLVLSQFDARLRWTPSTEDGDRLTPGQAIGRVEGPARGLLMAERVLLNLLGHLSGIATLTRRYVDAVAGTKARIFDTRKTIPGWRRLEKYAVRCGGGWNHRTGLFEAVLIKDNHLAFGAAGADAVAHYTPADAVLHARRYLKARLGEAEQSRVIVEVEVDTLAQLDEVLPVGPDIVLLDNMPPEQMREAVARRDRSAPDVELEASGGVNLQTVRAIAASGVDRISVGALTHSAACLDIGLDWL